MWLSSSLLVGLLVLTSHTDAANPCAKRVVKPENVVCVCNSTYCDDVEPVGTLEAGQAVLYASTREGKRLERSVIQKTASVGTDTVVFKLNTKGNQEIFGFGGAFTDAAGINLVTLPENMQDMVMSSYYGDNGLEYVFGRVPIASTDFSTLVYSYDDVPNDFDLLHFNLTIEDFRYKIPFIKKAQQLAKDRLKLYSSPWSAPAWMKSTGKMSGGGVLRGEVNGKYYQTYTQYFMRFFEEYHKEGIDFWGTTLQNEPMSGLDIEYAWQTMYLSATMERDWLKGLFGPTMKANNLTQNIKIMMMDDQRTHAVTWVEEVLSDPEAAKYVDGTAIHWYEDTETPVSVLNTAHNRNKDYWMLYTEACNAYMPGTHTPLLGDWTRASRYAHNIIQDLTHFVSGWVDWNLCLDMTGGPNWAKNNVDAPIIIDKDNLLFYKQPMFYALGHFSKFIPPGSKRTIETINKALRNVEQVSFVGPDGRLGIVIHNNGDTNVNVAVQSEADPSSYYQFVSEKHSLSTVLLKN